MPRRPARRCVLAGRPPDRSRTPAPPRARPRSATRRRTSCVAATCGTSGTRYPLFGALPSRLTGQSAGTAKERRDARRRRTAQLHGRIRPQPRGCRSDSCAPPPPTAPSSSSCPRSGPCLARPRRFAPRAEPLDGPALSAAAGWARELGIFLVAGSVPEVVPDQEKLANTSVMFGPGGERLAIYRKIHMFDVEVGDVAYRESEHRAGRRRDRARRCRRRRRSG